MKFLFVNKDKMKETHDVYPKPDPVVYDTLEQTKEIIKNLENSNENYKLKNKNFENEVLFNKMFLDI